MRVTHILWHIVEASCIAVCSMLRYQFSHMWDPRYLIGTIDLLGPTYENSTCQESSCWSDGLCPLLLKLLFPAASSSSQPSTGRLLAVAVFLTGTSLIFFFQFMVEPIRSKIYCPLWMIVCWMLYKWGPWFYLSRDYGSDVGPRSWMHWSAQILWLTVMIH